MAYDGSFNRFPGGVVPPEFELVYLAKWAGIPAWELENAPYFWQQTYSIAMRAYNQAVKARSKAAD